LGSACVLPKIGNSVTKVDQTLSFNIFVIQYTHVVHPKLSLKLNPHEYFLKQ